MTDNIVKQPVPGQRLGLVLCQMLGIEPEFVCRITVDCPVNDLATVSVETYFVDVNTDVVLRRYQVVEIND